MNTNQKIPHYNEKIQELKNGSDIGYCRICNKYRPLSRDHIPPESCGNSHKVTITVGKNMFISQNGLNCRTICSECNNTLLGTNLDKEFKLLYDRLLSYKKSNISLPNKTLEINIDAVKVMRSIVGHFLSINVYGNETIKDILSKPINDNGYAYYDYRQFVLGLSSRIENCKIYYWYYPFYDIKIIPYFVYAKDIRSEAEGVIYGTLIKVFPIAIFLIDTRNSTILPNTSCIDFDSLSSLNKLVFNTEKIMPREWPDHPQSYELLGFTMGASIDIKR